MALSRSRYSAVRAGLLLSCGGWNEIGAVVVEAGEMKYWSIAHHCAAAAAAAALKCASLRIEIEMCTGLQPR